MVRHVARRRTISFVIPLSADRCLRCYTHCYSQFLCPSCINVQSFGYFFGGVILTVLVAMAFLNGPRLLDWANSPPHLQFNKYVLTGYRPISSVQDCIRSLFYLHNELGNIYTHGKYNVHSNLPKSLTLCVRVRVLRPRGREGRESGEGVRLLFYFIELLYSRNYIFQIPSHSSALSN